MFDVGWSELLLIGVVALIVIGPEDLPKLFHTLGRVSARARAMGREFTSAMEDAARSSGLDEAGKSLREVNNLTSKRALGLDALERATERFERWDPLRPDATRKDPRPDPDAPAPAPAPAAPPPTAAPAAPPAGQPAGTVTGEAPLPPPPGITAPLAPPPPAGDAAEGAGRRRLHAVRRSDLGLAGADRDGPPPSGRG